MTTRDAFVHVLPETSSEDRAHILEDSLYYGCWCHPRWVFEGDGYIRVVHQDTERSVEHDSI
jgi:hypothetical protein